MITKIISGLSGSSVVFKHLPAPVGYLIGSDGSVWSRNGRGRYAGHLGPNWRRLRSWTDQRGYVKVTLRGRITHCVHRLVLCTFIGPCPRGHQARHVNDDKQDNSVANLRWGTPKENCRDRTANKRTAVGERVGSSKLSSKDIILAFALFRSGLLIREIAERLDVDASHMSKILRGRYWRITADPPLREFAWSRGAAIREQRKRLQ